MRTITTAFFSTLSAKQFCKALKWFLPWNISSWESGKNVGILEEKMKKLTTRKFAKGFYNCRSALYHGLKAIGVKAGDEVILQAYTCVSVPNAIIALGAKPVYVDIDQASLNIDPEKIKSAITDKTKCIIVQHTFGIPADLDKILGLATEHNLPVVEDAAHSLGASYNGKPIGSFGIFSVFSFGRDKVISGVNGGVLVTNNEGIFKKLPILDNPSKKLTAKNLFYPIIAGKSRLTYDFFGLGKILIFSARKFHILPDITSTEENSCLANNIFNLAMPNPLADFINQELDILKTINDRRRELAKIYFHKLSDLKNWQLIFPTSEQKQQESIFLRFTVLVPAEKREEIYQTLHQHKIILGRWYDKVIAPLNADLTQAQYLAGSCPVAEKVASRTLNLPNHRDINEVTAIKVADKIKELYGV